MCRDRISGSPKEAAAPADAAIVGRYEAPPSGDWTTPVTGVSIASFRVGPIPVRIELPFFLIAVLLGINARRGVLLLGWVAVVFVSILVHELGHAVVGRAFGERVSIVLHATGGLTFRGGKYTGAGEDIAVSLAGSLTQIVVLGVPALWLLRSDAIDSYTWYVIVHDLAWVSLGWAIINLLPILPLDGGNIALTILRLIKGSEAERIARLISVGTALALAIWAYHRLGLFVSLFALFFAVSNAAALARNEV